MQVKYKKHISFSSCTFSIFYAIKDYRFLLYFTNGYLCLHNILIPRGCCMNNFPSRDIQRIIGYSFENESLLEQAFVRSSYAKENPGLLDNEKLEFYGDAALDYYITRAMYNQFSEITEDGQLYSEKTEHDLTEIRSYNVGTKALAHCIAITGLQNYLLMNKSDIKNQVQNSPAVMADLFEAIIGAVAIDSEWDFEDISNVCRTMLKLLSFDINYLQWLNNWCNEQDVHYNFYKQSQYVYIGASKQGFDLSIREFNIQVSSDIPDEYPALIDCAKQVYELIEIDHMRQIVGCPDRNNAVSQLNVLYQKGFIKEPKYTFCEEYDEDGNPVWRYSCELNELDEVYFGTMSVKKYAKREAAYEALCALLGETPRYEDDDCNEDDFGDNYFYM